MSERAQSEPLRLLPWAGPEGKPCHLSGDPAGEGPVSRLADDMEALQFAMGAEPMGYAREMAADLVTADPQELRYLAARLCESLGDALRIAESRGTRLAAGGGGSPGGWRGDG